MDHGAGCSMPRNKHGGGIKKYKRINLMSYQYLHCLKGHLCQCQNQTLKFKHDCFGVWIAMEYDLCIVGTGLWGSAASRHASKSTGRKVCLIGPSEPTQHVSFLSESQGDSQGAPVRKTYHFICFVFMTVAAMDI